MSEIKRKLATIRTIATISAIEGADRIRKITFTSCGWQCVTNAPVNIGDKVVYFEVDSVLPRIPLFDWMAAYKYRVKTAKFKGQISQGLSIPLEEIMNAFPNVKDVLQREDNIPEGMDLTDILGVVKYEIPETVQIGGEVKGSFPGFIEKTDEERAANVPNLNELLATIDFIARTKIDGTSSTFYLYNGEFGVCGRNQELKDTENNTYWKIARKYNIEERLRSVGQNLAIQGEIAGPGIQSNRAKLSEVQLFVFTIQALDESRRLTDDELARMLHRLNEYTDSTKLQQCPLVGIIKAGTLKTIEDLAKYSDGPTLIPGAPETVREGVVLRSIDGKISMKQISARYLLKHDL
jgi:RNA ligase (TIGR02306 family)